MKTYLTNNPSERIQAINFESAQKQTKNEVIGQLIEDGEIINGKAITKHNYENLN